MGIILDIILVAIVIICIVYGAKGGFFKSLAAFLSGIAALLLSYTLTPALSVFIKEKLIIDGVSRSLSLTFASIAEAGHTAEGAVIYDISRLLSDTQFSRIAERAGLSPEAVIEKAGDGGMASVEAAARAVAEPLSGALASAVAFILIFIISFAVLRLFAHFIGLVFKLPVLRQIDKTLGLVFGGVCALFFVWVFAMSADSLAEAIAGVAPSLAAEEMVEGSILCRLFANINPLAALSEAIENNL